MSSEAGALARPEARIGSLRAVRIDARYVELAAVLGLLLVAALVRDPELQTLPRFTDETDDTLYSVAIYNGRILPLTNFNTYNSALFNYLTAALFWLFGPNLYLPRLLVFGVGVLTVGVTYGLGRSFSGPLAGFVAAALLATSFVHVALNSHVAWSNCTTPLFTTLAFWALYVGAKPWLKDCGGRPWALPVAGFLFGVALQTHPSVVLLLPGAALFVLASARGALQTRWPWLALVAFLVGYAPMVLFNYQTGFASTQEAGDKQQLYVGGQQTTTGSYQERLADELLAFPAFVGSLPADAEDRIRARPTDPRWLLGLASGLAGLIWAARRGNTLPAIVVVTYLALVPVMIDRYERLVDARYLTPLLPLTFGAFGQLVADTGRGMERPGWSARRLAGLALAGLTGLLILLPLLSLHSYFSSARSTGAPFLSSLATIQTALRPGEQVIVDSDLAGAVRTGDGRIERIYRALLASSGLPYVVVDVSREWLSGQLARGETDLLVIEPSKARRLEGDYQLDQLARASEAARSVNVDFGTYRVTALKPTPAGAEGRPAGDKLARQRAEKARINSSEQARSRIPE